MPRRLLGVFIFLLASLSVAWAQGELVLLTVGPERVERSEFEYRFSRSLEKRADVFAESYGRFRQKVLYAKELGLDTLASFRRQKEYFHRMLKQRREALENGLGDRREGKEWVRLAHVTYPLKQSARKQDLAEGKRYMDSLYTVLKSSAEVRQMEELPWMQSRYLLNEWQNQLKTLAKDEISRPFVSPMGIHIVLWKERRMDKPAESKKPMTDEAWMASEAEDALLVVALDDYWKSHLACTEQELEEHFKKFRSDYGGGTPHFKGAVVHCRDKKEAKVIKKYLKKYPENLWKQAVERMPEDMAKGCRVETGLFAIGTNRYVDKLVFKCGSFEPLADYPYTWVLGKKLKKGPTDYRDVRSQVEKQSREAKKKAEMEALERKYRVEIDKEVLKTVNRAENK